MKIFILLLFMTFLMSFKPTGCLEMDIVILCDLSGSVQEHEPFVMDAVDTFIDRIEISDQSIRIGVIGFDDNPFTMAGLQGNKEELKAIIKDHPFSAQGGTRLAPALETTFNELFKSRRHVQKLIILISDGAIGDRSASLDIIAQLNSLNVGICGVLIKNSSSQPEFMKEISSNCYVETSYENLASELEKMDICL